MLKIVARTFYTVVGMLGAGLATDEVALAQFCTKIETASCRPSSVDSEQCRIALESLYACQRYADILLLLSDIRIALKPSHEYFLGASYYGLFSRAKSDAVKCDYGSKARSSLESFLTAVEETGNKTGVFGSPSQLRYVYSANKLFTSLKELKGCLEPGHTHNSLLHYATNYASQALKNALFMTPQNLGLDTASRDFWASLGGIMKSLSTTASQSESGLGIKESEAETSDYYYTRARDTLKTLVEVEEIQTGLQVNLKNLQELDTKVKTSIQAPIKAEAKTIKDLIEFVDEATFDAARGRLIGKARVVASHLAFASEFYEKELVTNPIIPKFAKPSSSPLSVLRRLQSQFAKKKGCREGEKVWYCQKQE